MKDSDLIKEARERFDEIGEKEREQRELMSSDLKFSNPSGPEQWPEDMVRSRLSAEGGARPCLVFDQTNTYLNHVKNASRENKPSIVVRPFDSKADPKVADALTGIIRHIEDYSRADIAYVTANDYSIMAGIGYFEIATKVIDGTLNHQEIVINRIPDIFSVRLDCDWQEPDGSDAMHGFLESKMSKRAFQRKYKDASSCSFSPDSKSWFDEDSVRLAKYYNVTEKRQNMLVIEDPELPDQDMILSEDDYWRLVEQSGLKPPVVRSFWDTKREVKCYLMSGEDVLDESIFPASYIPIIPIIGNEIFIDGKRHLSGMTRAMKDPQRAYNYERNNYIEHVSLQNKIPYTAAAEAIEGYEELYRTANSRNIGVLPFNHKDADGMPLPPPNRQQAPAASSAYVQGAQMALSDLQAAVGMFQANIGATSNETSGKAINARKEQGETSSYHFLDNRNRSLKHAGRIIVEMIPKVFDTKRMVRILGEDGSSKTMQIDPSMPQAAMMKNGLLQAFNPSIGTYDVSIQVGPAFGTRRQEALQQLTEMVNGNPQIFSVLGDQIAKLSDMPDADKIASRLKYLQPPELRQAEEAESSGNEAPEITAVKTQMTQQLQAQDAKAKEAMQQMAQQGQAMQAEIEKLNQALQNKMLDHKAEIQKEMIKAQASVQVEQIKANAAPQSMEPVHSEPAAPVQPVQIFTGDNPPVDSNDELIAQVSALTQAVTEQNSHLFLAVSAIADKLSEPEPPEPPEEPQRIAGRMVRAQDGSYMFEAVKNNG